MYHAELKKGMIIPCYLDYKNEEKFWYNCQLLERVSVDENTFVLDNEKIYQDPPITNNLFTNTQETNIGNLKYLRLEKLVSVNKISVKKFVKSIRKRWNPRLFLNYNSLYKFIEKESLGYNEPDELKTIFTEYDIDYLVRFFQQTFAKKWRPMMFYTERWLIVTVPNDKFETPFRTHKNFRVLSKQRFDEDDEDDEVVEIPVKKNSSKKAESAKSKTIKSTKQPKNGKRRPSSSTTSSILRSGKKEDEQAHQRNSGIEHAGNTDILLSGDDRSLVSEG